MRIEYASRQLERVCTDAAAAVRAYGKPLAVKLRQRIKQLRDATSAAQMIQDRTGRCHALAGDRRGQYALDLAHPYRLVFEQRGDVVRIALILEIVDYH